MKRKVLKKKEFITERGITLIALVVTIIVLLILAGISISMLTGQNGIINRAEEAKKKTEISGEKDAVSLAALEALTEGTGTITKEKLEEKLKTYLGVTEVNLVGNGPWQYEGTEGAYTITIDGSTAKGWICRYDENGAPTEVTNGEITLNIGDYINYNPDTNGTKSYTSPAGTVQTITYQVTDGTTTWGCAEASAYQEMLDKGEVVPGNGNSDQAFATTDAADMKWKVLGADEETGELLIVSADKVKNLTLRGITGYLNGVKEINKICEVYGQGKGATKGRSITLDDVNKVIGRPKGTNGSKYTYTWTPDSLTKKAPSYNGETNYLSYPHVRKDDETQGVFNYYNTATKKWETNKRDLTQVTQNEQIGTIKPDYVGYGSVAPEQEATKGYNVVFKTANGGDISDITAGSRYWLGSSYVFAYSDRAYWGVYNVYAGGYVNGYGMYNSFGCVNTPACGVRPVVSLKSDIQLQSDSSMENTYNIVED